MIKINLIGEKKVQKTRSGSSGGFKIESTAMGKNLVLALILLLGAGVAGTWWYAKNKELAEWKAKKIEAEKELVRLEEVRKKGEYYKQQKERLERQIQLVTNLKKRQAVPVHILDQVSKNLPEFTWLSQMSAQSNSININGKATTYNAVSNFYNNLNESGFFQDVVLGRASEVPAEGVAFSLMCKFTPPEAETPADTETPAQAETPANES